MTTLRVLCCPFCNQYSLSLYGKDQLGHFMFHGRKEKSQFQNQSIQGTGGKPIGEVHVLYVIFLVPMFNCLV